MFAISIVKKLINKETIMYTIFGILTTLINYVVFIALTPMLGPVVQNAGTVANLIAAVVAILFAYITNKLWVFEKKSFGKGAFAEFCRFILSRVATLVLGTILIFITVDFLGQNEFIWKGVETVLVVILNYFLSKTKVFT